jgi:putative ABC transport system ATP-binding protein
VTNEKYAVEFDDVWLEFPRRDGQFAGLAGVTGAVEKGQTVTIVGPSGSGKTTLLYLCNLLLTATRGVVKVFGRDVREWNPAELRRQVGMVFQKPVMLPGTVLDNLLLGLKLNGKTSEDVTEWLQRVGLHTSLLDQPASTLSGGQQQRVALLRTVLNRPKVLLLDEVTSALDPESTALVEHFVQSVREQLDCSVLWVTHDLEQARRMGDVTWLVIDGRIAEAGPSQALFEHPQTEHGRRFLQSSSEGDAQP